MGWFGEAAWRALGLITAFDPGLWEIVAMSLLVSCAAVAIGGIAGIPAGVALGLNKFPAKGLVVNVLNTLMGLPPVVVGLVVFLMLSRQGLFGRAQLLFTPTAMVIAQSILVFPIIAALVHASVASQDVLLRDTAKTLGASRMQAALLVLLEARYGIVAALTAGFGRAIAEVGAVLMVGGNIKGATRVMTTTIALQTSMGDYELALALGFILLALAFGVNGLLYRLQRGPRWQS